MGGSSGGGGGVTPPPPTVYSRSNISLGYVQTGGGGGDAVPHPEPFKPLQYHLASSAGRATTHTTGVQKPPRPNGDPEKKTMK